MCVKLIKLSADDHVSEEKKLSKKVIDMLKSTC